MQTRQFGVLYRHFLLRFIDLEAFPAHGATNKMLGRIAALLLFIGTWLSLGALGIANGRNGRRVTLTSAWPFEHLMIATTMLAAGLLAVLSWDSLLPDRRDVLALAPLPVRDRTWSAAKIAAAGTALAASIAAVNLCTSLALPLALAPDSSSVVELILSPELYRAFAAYWITVLAAGALVFGAVLALQGLAAQFLARRLFLRASALLQIAAFFSFVGIYFLQPWHASLKALAAPELRAQVDWLPSYWFLALFQQLNGAVEPVIAPLATRAEMALAIVGTAAALAYAVSYCRTLRKIVEEPDILVRSRESSLPPFGDSLSTAIVQFSIRSFLRSRQHRLILAFYLGTGFAIAVCLSKTVFADGGALVFSSWIIMCAAVVGMRAGFGLPLSLRANWVFRITEVRSPRVYFRAIRRPLFALAVWPVWLVFTAMILLVWPSRPAVMHAAVLALWGLLLGHLSLNKCRKIPFTCSYAPGKTPIHMAFLAALALIYTVGLTVRFEMAALNRPGAYAKLLVSAAIAALAARWRTVTPDSLEQASVLFEDAPEPPVLSLGLHGDHTLLPGRFS